MAQQQPFNVTDTPSNLSAAYPAGQYIAQAQGQEGGIGILYATGAAAPADDSAYFSSRANEYFTFPGGPDVTPTWVKVADGLPSPASLSVADYA